MRPQRGRRDPDEESSGGKNYRGNRGRGGGDGNFRGRGGNRGRRDFGQPDDRNFRGRGGHRGRGDFTNSGGPRFDGNNSSRGPFRDQQRDDGSFRGRGNEDFERFGGRHVDDIDTNQPNDRNFRGRGGRLGRGDFTNSGGHRLDDNHSSRGAFRNQQRDDGNFRVRDNEDFENTSGRRGDDNEINQLNDVNFRGRGGHRGRGDFSNCGGQRFGDNETHGVTFRDDHSEDRNIRGREGYRGRGNGDFANSGGHYLDDNDSSRESCRDCQRDDGNYRGPGNRDFANSGGRRVDDNDTNRPTDRNFRGRGGHRGRGKGDFANFEGRRSDDNGRGGNRGRENEEFSNSGGQRFDDNHSSRESFGDRQRDDGNFRGRGNRDFGNSGGQHFDDHNSSRGPFRDHQPEDGNFRGRGNGDFDDNDTNRVTFRDNQPNDRNFRGRGGRRGRGKGEFANSGGRRGNSPRGAPRGNNRGRGGQRGADQPGPSGFAGPGMMASPEDETSEEMHNNNNSNPRLAINIFGLELGERTIFRHIVQIKLLDPKTKKDYILTTMSSRGRGNRASKQSDNIILLGKLFDKWAQTKEVKAHPTYAYDGAQSLFTLEGISMYLIIPNEEALKIPGISNFLKDSITFLNGDLEISCEPDLEKPSFNQTEINEWNDSRFYAYLDIVTSQSAIRSGKYLSQSRGLYVNTQYMERLRVGWAVAAKGIHKGCRIVGSSGPLPILELDPQSTQYYAPIPLNEMLQLAFPRDFPPNRIINPNMKLQRAAKILMKELKCNPFYEDLSNWATNTVIVTDIDYNAPKDQEYREKYKNIKFPMLPAAVCGIGARKRLMPLEYLRVLPYQSIDRRVLEEFDLTPRANTPDERWKTLQKHYEEFGFNDEVMNAFGVTICNDPFTNISEIDGERVDKPTIAYADPVHVDDEKRDWKAQDKKFVSAAKIDYLMFVLIAGYPRNFDMDRRASEFVAHAFMQRCREKGVQVGQSDFRCYEGERGAENFLTGIFKDLVTHPRYNDSKFTPFVLFISDDVPNIHECLKFEERMSDIPTQHVLLKNVRKMKDNIEKKSQGNRRAYDLTLDNIVMKANIKCGGLNYTADTPRDIACWSEVSTFVMGMDVAHPDRMATREGNPSTVGLSCNSAENPYSFIGDFHYTDPRKEAIQDEILRRFTDQNVQSFAEIRGFPKKIIIFRDGVSFGEESEALREVEIIEQTIIDAAKASGLRDYAPKVLAVVVKKRHHTRFYAKSGYQGNQPTNPLPDTSVGGDIAEYGKRQIFIQAFRPVQGTAKIPSFLVIRDDEEVSDDYISRLVCAVCSLHQLVNSPTSIPTPVYVAHELAKRGTGLFKAYRFKKGDLHSDWTMLTSQLSYSTLDRLSKVRVV